MRTFFLSLLAALLLIFGSAWAEEADFALSIPGQITGYSQQELLLTSPQAGTVTLVLTDGLGQECLRLAEDLPVQAGENVFVWDGLGVNQEPLQQLTYTLTATFVTPDGIHGVSQPVKVGRSKQALVYALPSGKTLYLDGGLDWFAEVKMVRTGMLCVAFYHAEDMENPIVTKRKTISTYKSFNYDWDGIINGQRQPAGEYVLRFWAEENPAYAVDIPVTLVDGAYTLPELTVAADYLPQDGLTDAELWTWMQRPLTVVDLKSTSHQKLYAEPSTKSKSLGTVHGQSQGVQILQAPVDGWVKVGAYNHEDGSWTEGYVQEDRLMTLPTDSDYGLLLDKRTQTLVVFHQGARIGELKVSTGLVEKNKLYQETTAGAFFTLEHMSDFSLSGNNYDYVIRYDGGNLLHQCAYRMTKDWKDFSIQSALLGTKASHGCVRIQNRPDENGLNAYWLWTHLPYHTKVLILDDPDARTREAAAVSGNATATEAVSTTQEALALPQAETPPELTPEDMELVITLGGDVVLGTREKWQDSPQGLPAYLEQYGLDYPFANLTELFEDDDMTLVNLECVLKDDASNMTKNKQYIFRGATSYAQALVDASIEQVNLANNHVIDYQSAGEASTREALAAVGVAYSGYGDVYVWDYNGHKIGFGGCRETTFKQDPGVIQRDVEQLKAAACEVILYSCHWGTEYDPKHNDLQEQMAQAAISAGVDIVIGTHPHVVQGVDAQNGTVILYSLGNLMFGGTHDMTTFDGTLARLRLRFDILGRYQGVVVELLPVLTSSSGDLSVNNFCPVLAEGEDWTRIWDKIQADTPFALSSSMWFPVAGEE